MVATRSAAGKRKPWVPDRQDIIWIDCNPQAAPLDCNPAQIVFVINDIFRDFFF